MKILVMTDTPANPDSGAAGTEYQTINALRRLGHDVDAVWSDSLGRRIRHGNLHYLLELPLTYKAQMLRHLARGEYHIVHASQPHGWLAAWTARHQPAGPKFVHRSHGLEPRVAQALERWDLNPRPSPLKHIARSGISKLLSFNNRAIARNAHGHIVSSSLCGDFLVSRMNVDSRRVAVIPQAAPQDYLDFPPPEFDERRLDRILYVGQFEAFKAPTVLSRAFRRILETNSRATLTWVCSAQHHAQAAALLDDRSRERVQFLDVRPQQELRSVYDEHGVFLFPSFFEGFGKALLEAMSRGLVVIASDEGGAHDLVHTNVNGMRVPVGDAAALADACVRVQSDPHLAQALGRAARSTAEVQTWNKVAQDTAAFYERLLEMR